MYLCQQATQCRWAIADIKRFHADWAVTEHALQDGQEEGHAALLGASKDTGSGWSLNGLFFALPCLSLSLHLLLAVSLPQWEGPGGEIHILQQREKGLHAANRCKHILITWKVQYISQIRMNNYLRTSLFNTYYTFHIIYSI